ncbi:lipoprotein-releasing ABC transporter permease subunit [Chelatococcus asaccharovorans]|uniref:Lipoprotein-releasing system permease protein n=1 Tax=Chelatococcus asaccharovorans TaxID=28210 RepID=A0A2V3U423_9HYPH|nr:lipoprotein-releasing ABC transporter permease subunit [Chelatococcus asaccharovorans]MBS7702953.1 lipoprotein-releasing ABC transporter permease subunit [Chelatococcus asaccharovorans]PXW57251.1 lipoprotein-releasing system permease protein [Chelatococcus asaccharovorans]CAH1674203.1 Lipoprotein releasing system transmembrane protein LolE [Chelatococcus asaccharovorans]CAH1674413.1 Lipoprotein releasing system transmembrane protein LolE [Chelatococcus asaccharovorans]
MSAEPGSDSTRPFAGFEWMLASRYLRARRREGFISVIAGFSFLGIMLGVATLIVVMSVMNGFREELLSKIVGVNGHIFVQPIDQPLTDYAAVAQRIAGVDGVTLAVPLVEGQALASASQSGNNGGALVRGVREQDIKHIPFIANTIREGTLAGFDEKGGVAIGRRLAEFLGVRVGDSITIISPRGSATPMGVAPRIKSYPVVAVFEIGMSEFDGSFVYMPMQEAQAFFNRDGDVSLIEVFLRNADDVDTARDRIDAAAGRPIMMSDWRQRNRTFFSALEVERNVMFLILTLIVLVAALNIISGLIMLVKDKSEDIAILRTMGATRGAVMRVFLITGASIGIVGTIAGFFLGLVITLNVERIRAFMSWLTDTNLFPAELYFLSRLPAVIEPGEVVTVVTMAIVLSLIATLYPSWRAARLDPVEALRYG